MRNIAILSFSEKGAQLAERIAAGLNDCAVSCHVPRGNLSELTEALFRDNDALIFVGACGIAVRAVAPYLRDKTRDPAVVVVDELGLHAISLLSGHIGGANALAREIAEITGAEAVITTATDINRRFSVDEWARRNGLRISSMQAAKRFSAEILLRDMPLISDFPIERQLPKGVYFGEGGAVVSVHDRGAELLLVPKILHLGIGCKRGTPEKRIAAAVDRLLTENCIAPDAVKAAASIDVKKDEVGLLDFCGERGIPIEFFSAEELRNVPGEFSASDFVRNAVGVENVCERAAMCSAGADACLIVRKTCMDGVTAAVAQEDWRVCFE